MLFLKVLNYTISVWIPVEPLAYVIVKTAYFYPLFSVLEEVSSTKENR